MHRQQYTRRTKLLALALVAVTELVGCRASQLKGLNWVVSDTVDENRFPINGVTAVKQLSVMHFSNGIVFVVEADNQIPLPEARLRVCDARYGHSSRFSRKRVIGENDICRSIRIARPDS